MFGLFNSKSRWAVALQVSNTAGFILTAIDYYTNPDAKASVNFPMMANYAFNVYNLSERSDAYYRTAGFLVNLFSVGALYRDFTSNCNTVSPYLNALAATNLIATALSTAGTAGMADKPAEPKPATATVKA